MHLNKQKSSKIYESIYIKSDKMIQSSKLWKKENRKKGKNKEIADEINGKYE